MGFFSKPSSSEEESETPSPCIPEMYRHFVAPTESDIENADFSEPEGFEQRLSNNLDIIFESESISYYSLMIPVTAPDVDELLSRPAPWPRTIESYSASEESNDYSEMLQCPLELLETPDYASSSVSSQYLYPPSAPFLSFVDATISTLSSDIHYQMIRELETSQCIDLSHLSAMVDHSDLDHSLPPPGNSRVMSSAGSESRTSSLSEWLSSNIQRIRRGRFVTIDEVLHASSADLLAGSIEQRMTTLRDGDSSKAASPGTSRHSGSLHGWQRLRSFLLRRRSI